MKGLALSAAVFIASFLANSASAQNLGILDHVVGERITLASARVADHIDWGKPDCGEPKYLSGTCVWTLGSKFSLTANILDRSDNAGTIVSRWRHFDLRDLRERAVFDQACRALIAALRPDWSTGKVAEFTKTLIGSARKDHAVRAEGILFAFYTYPETLTCEAQPAT